MHPNAFDQKLNPCELFELFLPDEILEIILKYSLEYAISKHREFTSTVEELRVFFAILILSGYCSLPRRKLFWSKELDVKNDMAQSSMRRDRFDYIMKNLHLYLRLEIMILKTSFQRCGL